MEIDSNNVAEIEKYAFLLGSAIKNEDTEQFFSIYDKLLPKDLPDTQVQTIKSKALAIADLPEGEFNDLVFKARSFSLAPAGTTMSCSDSPSKKWVHHYADDSEDDEGVGSTRFSHQSCGKSDTSSHYSSTTTKISTLSSVSDTHGFEDDSGVCNSSKATNSTASMSDQEGVDYEGPRYFEFYPKVKIRSGTGLSLDYDEAHEVKSDQSSQDVNSPRSDISDGREMVTYSTSYNPSLDDDDDDDEFQFSSSGRRPADDQDDFNTDGDSDEDRYKLKSYKERGYLPVHRESEYQNQNRTWLQPKSYDSMGYTSAKLPSREYDDKIAFTSLKEGTSHYSRYSINKTAGSEKVKIEKNSYKKDQPPFGRGEEQLHKVGNSVGKLISKIPADREVENMPEGRKLEPLTPEESKKKKKKKKGSRDDATTDENGNPVELGLKPSAYRQMRESPSTVGGTAGSNRQHTETHYGDTLTSLSYTSKDTDDASNKTQEPRKRRKKKEANTKRSEDVDNYIGNKPIEELVLLIDGGQNASSKKSKKLSPSVTDDIPAKTPKTNKKSKDKKQKSPTPSNSLEEIEAKGDGPAQKSVSETELSSDNMGNLSAKTDENIPVENGDMDGMYCKKEKLTKPLLKDDDRKDSKCSIIADSTLSDNKSMYCKESVKEKNGPKTNIKREVVSETNTEKKKSEKQKTPKQEKLEMSASKSEEALKLESSITVKQKNAKNKKSKPMSQTNSDNIGASLISEPVINSISDDNLIGDTNFIFTDLDGLKVPREDEFQLVGKKKKKAVKEVVPQNNFIGNNKPQRRFDEKRAAPTNQTIRSPAPTATQTSPVETDSHARDLSPSAFPALVSGKGRQSLQDGRRNSTGDVPIPSEVLLKSQDDSDIESVKSLPATQGGHTIDNMLSPRLNVSYAKMAASSKQGSNSGERSSLECESDEKSEHELKKAMWKGSPTERRHSIGSSPEGIMKMNKNSSDAIISAATSFKAGSQENIKGEMSVPSRLEPKMNSESPLGGDDVSREKIVAEPSVSDMVEFGVGSIEVVNLSSMPVQNIHHVSSVAPKATCPADSPVVFSSNTKLHPAEKLEKLASADSQLTKLNSGSSNDGNYSKSSSNGSNVHKQDTQKAKVVHVNNKKQKSVIFLDKPFEETPGNLGISFGFEIEPMVNKSNRTDVKSMNKPPVQVVKPLLGRHEEDTNSSDGKSKDNFTNLDPDDGGDMKLDVEIDEKLSHISSSSSVINDRDCKQESASAKTENTVPLGKVSSQLSRLNGVVSSPQGQNVSLSKENSSDTVNEVDSSTSPKIAQGEQTVKKVPQPNEVIVYYGEGVATLKKDVLGPSQTNGPTRYCGLVTFVQESDLRSNFSLADAAFFLTTDWEKIKQLQDRDPDKVKVHQN